MARFFFSFFFSFLTLFHLGFTFFRPEFPFNFFDIPNLNYLKQDTMILSCLKE